ncbi:MAG: glycosyltransferase family 39 protein [Acidobacteriaceae bacterium]|nr:glycosyltransferase family 39 protein [Acidobacteriaceae bacterium]
MCWKKRLLWLTCIGLALLRLAHMNLLWADEDYHLAAAIQTLQGKMPYRDFWYDKPPLSAFYYLLIGGHWGWPLRLLDAGYVLLACYIAYRLARDLWGEAEGRIAALLFAFYMAFYLPSAVIPFAADAVMMAPHVAAIYCAQRRYAFWAGVWSGVGFLANTKAVFVLASCAVWLFPEVLALFAGFAVVVCAGAGIAIATGAWAGYVEQVWRWGLLYAKGSPVVDPLRVAVVRTLDWLGFHAALAVCGGFGFAAMSRSHRWKLGSWLIVSFVALSLGGRFAPHYFLQLLPGAAIVGSRGIVVATNHFGKRALAAVAILLLVPLVRFGPRYALLAFDDIEGQEPHWRDVGMDVDSRDVANKIRSLARDGDSLFVWGYRPDVYVYTRLVPAGRFSDSQPLTGVPADRHLSATTAIYGGPAGRNRQELARTRPTFIVDGLGLLNRKLTPAVYPDLREWLAHYRVVGRTKLSVIYERVP